MKASGVLTGGLVLTLCSSTLAKGIDEFTFSCETLTIQRSDPIMFPGKTAGHVHIVAGGTAFQQTMDIDTATKANETTCGVVIDKSNYWIPQLYHRAKNGAFELVENDGNVVYYLNRACNYTEGATSCDGSDGAIAPPAGLRVVAGDTNRRTYDDADFAQRATTHMCIGEDGSSSETNNMPNKPCAKLRSQVFLPSCWDGQNIDSKDHRSHMAYPASGDYNSGVCPKSHPVAILSIFLEFFFNTHPFPDHDNWVYSNGDATGYGLHGDYINGWEDQVALGNAMKTCTGPKLLNDPKCSLTKHQKRPLTPVKQTPEIAASEEEIGQNGRVLQLPGHNLAKS
ncbi:hypothetical protein P168DRAFT_276618 [Aspergillus campestris IBT 28561]|uniref:DUF1996 domain-containing protein n=1 Tax=Aspergillus campestris (strain IBT 28561) TaxID=1392248 RepID=A0A2I1CRE0_ASPC2|nr:uncharacterized protein P168DRAFT_276618 [Aspergillus campestris IBT 28561]PKY00178.1 hypothetical protein P168DRAFT_276618 [Aspergillus campestris IBT 28561]